MSARAASGATKQASKQTASVFNLGKNLSTAFLSQISFVRIGTICFS
jgi:hypothetical protein